jgi:hypothetical protein
VGQEKAKQIGIWKRRRGRKIALDCSIIKGGKVKRLRIKIRKF